MNGLPVPPVVSKGAGATDANTLRVVVATDDTVTVNDNALPLPSNAAQENNGNLSAILTELQAENASDGPSFVAVTGDPSGDFAGVNLLEAVMDDATGLYLNTKVINPPKTDVNGNAIASDAPAPINIKGVVGQQIIIDTQGYQSLAITFGALIANFGASNDLVNWSSVSGASTQGNSTGPTNSQLTSWIFPCSARYIRLTVSSPGSAVAYLRSAPCPFAPTLMIQGAGVNSSGGGVLAVGGAVAPGAALAGVTFPITLAGVDSGEIKLAGARTLINPSPLIRTLLTDTTGRLRLAAENAFASQGGQVLSVTDQSQFEGQSQIELLAMILQELKIMTLYLSELPRMLNAGLVASDEPATFRSDPTIFNQ